MVRRGDHRHHLVPGKARFGPVGQMKVDVLRVWKMDTEQRPVSFDAYCVGCESETLFDKILELDKPPRFACRDNHVLYGKDLNWKRIVRPSTTERTG